MAIERIDGHPRMLKATSLDDLIRAMAEVPDFAVVMWDRPELRENEAAWRQLGRELAPCCPNAPHHLDGSVPYTGVNRYQVRARHMTNPGAHLEEAMKQAVGDSDPFGISSENPLYRWMLDDFGEAYRRVEELFDANIVDIPELFVHVKLDTFQTKGHNAWQKEGHITDFHSDVTDRRMFCAYCGPGTTFAAPESVAQWRVEMSSDYPITVADLKEGAPTYELPRRAIAVFRGGPSLHDLPFYKDKGYAHRLDLRLPHGAPQPDPQTDPFRVTMLGEIVLRN